MIRSALPEKKVSPPTGMNRHMTIRLQSEAHGASMYTCLLAAAGTIVSFPQSLKKSYMGWMIGGPIRCCMRARTFLSMPARSSPIKEANRKPGKINICSIVVKTIIFSHLLSHKYEYDYRNDDSADNTVGGVIVYISVVELMKYIKVFAEVLPESPEHVAADNVGIL